MGQVEQPSRAERHLADRYAGGVLDCARNHRRHGDRAGEIAPFPLTNYDEVINRAGTIKYVTGIRYMPPWKPDPTYRNYQHENYLSDDEIATLGNWVDAGMPRGDVSKEPSFPNFPNGSQLGTPDLVISFAQTYTHKGNGKDEYRYFVLPTNLTEDKDLVALEMRPSNRKSVHHTLFWADNTGKARAEDAKSPEYGYASGSGSLSFGDQLPGYVPGQKPNLFNNGMSQKILKGSDLVLQMHFAPSTVDQDESSSVNLFFAKQPTTRTVYSKILLPYDLVNGPFIIPANTIKNFHAVYKVPAQVSLLGIWPHCHKLGKNWEVYALLPNGDQIPLIKIGEWDFNWQGGYYFQKLIVLPAGTEVHAFATYDNTTDNPVNPNSPPKSITWGENTSDEMFYLPISYVLYQPGDENILLANEDFAGNGGINENIKTELNPVFPNPITDEINIPFTLNADQQIQISMLNLMGQTVMSLVEQRNYMQGQHVMTFKTPNMENGVYVIQLKTKQGSWCQKLLLEK